MGGGIVCGSSVHAVTPPIQVWITDKPVTLETCVHAVTDRLTCVSRIYTTKLLVIIYYS